MKLAVVAEDTSMDALPNKPSRSPAHARLHGALARAMLRCSRIVHSAEESGQALVEFALCLPVLLMVVFGICTFGIAFENYLVLQNATNIGARQLAISRGQSTDPCSTASTAISNAASTLTTANLTFAFVLNGASYPGTSCAGGAAYMVQGATAKVTVTYPCTLSSYKWSFGPCTLTAGTAELIQ